MSGHSDDGVIKPPDSFWMAYDEVLRADRAYRRKRGPKEVIVALFDFLGFKNAFNKLGHARLRAIYEQLLSAATRDRGYMTMKGWVGGTVLGAFHPDFAYFSDTILLWHRWDPLVLPDFVRACGEIVCEGIENQIPLRGAISVGLAEMQNKKRIYFGLPIIEAVEAERAQQWVGMSLGPSAAQALSGRPTPTDAFNALIPYGSHVKQGFEGKVAGLVVDWPRIWREGKRAEKDAAEAINALDVDEKHRECYRRTRDFITFSGQHADWARQLPSPQNIPLRDMPRSLIRRRNAARPEPATEWMCVKDGERAVAIRLVGDYIVIQRGAGAYDVLRHSKAVKRGDLKSRTSVTHDDSGWHCMAHPRADEKHACFEIGLVLDATDGGKPVTEMQVLIAEQPEGQADQ